MMIAPIFAFRRVQCSIALAAVNVKKYHGKMKSHQESQVAILGFFFIQMQYFFVYWHGTILLVDICTLHSE